MAAAPVDPGSAPAATTPRAASSEPAPCVAGSSSGPAFDETAPDDADRGIADADLVQVRGDRVFVLSSTSGLTITELNDPANPRVLGRFRTSAKPLHLYLRDDFAYVVLNDVAVMARDEAVATTSLASSARILRLDVSNPAAIEIRGEYEIPGRVADSRLSGDVLYLVNFRDATCWKCDSLARSTRIVSLDLSNRGELGLLDELRFDDGWLPEKFTAERLYVRVPGATHECLEKSAIQVIDLSGPGGKLRPAARIELGGRLDGRWQMDEYAGVLRVVSGPGGLGSGATPVLETFAIHSSDDVAPLGRVEIHLHIGALRFDGPRAYLEGGVPNLPVALFDLANPAQPRQSGMLQFPEYLRHIEPRGERVYGLGLNPGSGSALYIAVFDVSDPARPTLLELANFTAPFGDGSFTVLPEQGLVAIPQLGARAVGECRVAYSGVQLIDLQDDKLAVRGVVPQIGLARRVMMHRDALLGISDDSLQSFDIANRDQPQMLAHARLGSSVRSLFLADERVVRLGFDESLRAFWLDVSARSEVDLPQPQGELTLENRAAKQATLLCERGPQAGIDPRPDGCRGSEQWRATLLARGDEAYVVHQSSPAPYCPYTSLQTAIDVVALTGPQPTLLTELELEPTAKNEEFGEPLLTPTALLVPRGRSLVWAATPQNLPVPNARTFAYEVFGLENPRAPRYAGRLELPDPIASGGFGHLPRNLSLDLGPHRTMQRSGSAALQDGNLVISHHLEEGQVDGQVQYFIDRLDFADPDNPRVLDPIPVSGPIVHFDAEAGLVVTLEERLGEVTTTTGPGCIQRSGVVVRDGGSCSNYDRVLTTWQLEGNEARMVEQHNLETDRVLSGLAFGDDRMFTLWHNRRTEPDTIRDTYIVGSFRMDATGTLTSLGDTTLPRGVWPDRYPALLAREQRAFVTDYYQLQVIDSAGDGQPTLTSHELPSEVPGRFDRKNSCTLIEADERSVLCPIGNQGVITFDIAR
jgi:hypothetical protein